jgi:hypothetical protein
LDSSQHLGQMVRLLARHNYLLLAVPLVSLPADSKEQGRDHPNRGAER